MIAIPLQIVENAIKDYNIEIKGFINAADKKLQAMLKSQVGKFNEEEFAYTSSLINELEEIILATPQKLELYKKEFNLLPTRITKKGAGRPAKPFKDRILESLGYKTQRSKFYPNYFAKIGIKSCVYCNSQLTVSIDSEEFLKSKTKVITKAKFQVDHYLPKSIYPCFSISLFNLYPVCGSCNIVKNDNEINFHLYSDDTDKLSESKYSFILDKTSLVQYLITHNQNELKVEFFDYEKPIKSVIVKGSFQDTFDIQGIYDTQMDLVEELILKAIIYNKSYKRSLVKSFSGLFTNASLSNRVLVGNYVEPQEIHKRPMAKFTQDIAKQLGLL